MNKFLATLWSGVLLVGASSWGGEREALRELEIALEKDPCRQEVVSKVQKEILPESQEVEQISSQLEEIMKVWVDNAYELYRVYHVTIRPDFDDYDIYFEINEDGDPVFDSEGKCVFKGLRLMQSGG